MSKGSTPRYDAYLQQMTALYKVRTGYDWLPKAPSLPQSIQPTRAQETVTKEKAMAQRKFKDGDEVALTKEYDGFPVGTTGIVAGVDSDYAIRFPQMVGEPGADSLHECGGYAPEKDGLWVSVAHLEAYTRPKVDFDKVIIEDEKRLQILAALEQINQQDLIFKTWDFASTIEKGRGVSLLFYGPPGTGKTLMAQAIADKLDYKLKIISTADIESSSPGESERNIRKHFKAAKNGKTILLFDECDSLIYTRASVGPIMSAQVNELLSQIERFNGITIFTTNRLGTLDEAVNRRLALKLEFAMPDPEQRAEIWRNMIPEAAPLASDIDWAKLAAIEVTGGYIKNAILRAARMAAVEKKADNEKQISMKHLTKALAQEAQSMLDFMEAQEEQRAGVGMADFGRGTGRIITNQPVGLQRIRADYGGHYE